MKLTVFELILVACYFIGMLAIGVWYRRASSKDMEAYFLGGRKTPWWMLGFSGSVSNFDIAGTTWVVGLFYFLGFKAFNMFWAMAFLIAAFLMNYLAAWIRRTRAMTAAELIHVRFGDQLGGQLARSAAALATSAFFLFALGYAFVGVAKFFEVSFDYDPKMCATVLMVVTGTYVLLGGFKGVILSDVVQAVLLNACGVAVAIVAFFTLDITALHTLMSPSAMPVWSAPELAAEGIPSQYQLYAMFGPFMILFVCKGLLTGAASPGGCYEEQRFLASASPRDAALTGAAWGGFLVFRWLMVGSIVFLAVTQLKGVSDPEQVLAKTVFELMPVWLRGFLVTGLLAAFMSTFSSTLNGVSSIIVRDLVQPMRPGLTSKQLIYISYGVTAACIIAGIAIGRSEDSIQNIWFWMQLALMPSLLFPNLLRWYWWRMNGWGYSIGVASGLALATLQFFKAPLFASLGYADVCTQWEATHVFDLYTFPVMGVAITTVSVVASLLTEPTGEKHLDTFFKNVRPKGWWGPVRQRCEMSDFEYFAPNGLESPWRIVTNIILAKIALFSFFLGPLYLVGHWFTYAGLCFVVCAVTTSILYRTWYCRLEKNSEEVHS